MGFLESSVERFVERNRDRVRRGSEFSQLSDGERGILALVLDLTRRLAQANPHLDDPAAEAEAVVLIDEIDLHLHPTWQRTIMAYLSERFPRTQFVVTAHSPLVVQAASDANIASVDSRTVSFADENG